MVSRMRDGNEKGVFWDGFAYPFRSGLTDQHNQLWAADCNEFC